MRKLMLFFILLYTVICTSAENITNFNLKHYSIEDGLATNSISTIIQDSKGYIWIGTEKGLCRFDGKKIKIFHNFDQNESINPKINNIISICQINEDELWIGTEKGLFIFEYKTESYKPFTYSEKETNIKKRISSYISCLQSDKGNNIWIGTSTGEIYRYNQKNKDISAEKVSVNNLPILQIKTDNQNNIWASGMDNLYKLNKVSRKFEIYRIKNVNNGIYSMAIDIDEKNNIWIGTWSDGLWYLDTNNHTFEKYLDPNINPQGITHIHSIEKYNDTTLFIGSDNGLTIFNTQTKQFKQYNYDNNSNNILSDRFIYPIMKDKEGGVWIGTFYNGINYLPPNINQFKGYSSERNNKLFKGNVISKFLEDNSGNIWIGSDDGGLSLFSPSQMEFLDYPNREELQTYNIHALYADENNLLIGAYSNGIIELNKKNGKINYIDTDSLYDNSVYSIYKDKEGTLWVGTMLGINKYDNEKKYFKRVKETIAVILDIKEDNNNNLWFASNGKGLFRLNKRENIWEHYMGSQNINNVTIDKNNDIWLATNDGLYKYDKKENKFYEIDINIQNKNINTILEDEESLWLTTDKGLIKYTPSTNEIQEFSKSDGLQSEAFVKNSGIKTKNGEFYIGSINGFNSFYPHELKRNTIKPKVVFTELEIFNKPVSISPNGCLNANLNEIEELNLSHDENVFSIEFAALSYCTPEKNKFAYKLEGFDKEWNYIGAENKVTYTNLPYKTYTLKVKASNNDNIWNEEGAKLIITINPPLYLTLPFKIIYCIIIICIIITILYYINKRNEKKHAKEYNRLTADKEKEMNEAKIEFFTMVAHEIRTPVSLIIGPLENIMKIATNFPIQIQRDLDITYRNSNRLLYLVNQLLDFRKVEQKEFKLHFSSQNIYDITQSVCERFQPSLLQKGVSLQINCTDKTLTADVDKEALTKIVSNLMTNANKYTKNSIEVIIKDTPENNFTICVKDNGKGMSKDEIKHIFKPFYQAKDNKPGTGIGLCIVKGLVEAHKGILQVDSTLDEGSTFNITLPKRQEYEDITTENNKDNTEDITSKNDTFIENNSNIEKTDKPIILIVDDNEDMLDFLSRGFSNNYTILTATDGEEAIKVLKKNETSLIISDWMMPNMNGIELCKFIREEQSLSHIPFILLTAKTDNDSKISGISCGADLYIEKPFSFEYLEACTKNLLELRQQLRIKFSKMPMVPIHSIASNSNDEEFLRKINEIIEENFSNSDLSVDFLAEKLCISRSGLFAKIKGLANVTPNEMIQIVRLKKAAALLLEGKYRINEVSFMVGFNNASYFSKCFQKQFGMKPGEFIGSQKQQQPDE